MAAARLKNFYESILVQRIPGAAPGDEGWRTLQRDRSLDEQVTDFCETTGATLVNVASPQTYFVQVDAEQKIQMISLAQAVLYHPGPHGEVSHAPSPSPGRSAGAGSNPADTLTRGL